MEEIDAYSSRITKFLTRMVLKDGEVYTHPFTHFTWFFRNPEPTVISNTRRWWCSSSIRLSSIRLSLCGGKEERRKNRLKTERVQFNQGNQSINHVMFAIHWIPLLLLGVGCWLLLLWASVSQNWVFQTKFLWLCFWSSLFWVKTERANAMKVINQPIMWFLQSVGFLFCCCWVLSHGYC